MIPEISERELRRIKASSARAKVAQDRRNAARRAYEQSPAGIEHQRQQDERYERILRHQAEWTEFEGHMVLRVEGSRYFAFPETGRKNARRFGVIDTQDRTALVCQLRKDEVRGWLTTRYLAELDDKEKE